MTQLDMPGGMVAELFLLTEGAVPCFIFCWHPNMEIGFLVTTMAVNFISLFRTIFRGSRW